MNPLLIRRRGMMKARQGGLPYDAELQWIATDGQAYIDTGYKPSNLSRMVLTMDSPTLEQTTWFFGCRTSGTSGQFAVINDKGSGQWQWRFGNRFASVSGTASPGIIVFDNLTSTEPRQMYINSLTLTPLYASAFTADYNLFIFTLNVAGTPALANIQAGLKFISMTMQEGTTMMLDFIPVRVGQVGYLYDRVSGQLFGNAGTGDFILGPDIQ